MVGLLLLTVSCTEDSSTQIVVLMDTDYAVPAEVDRIQARVSKMVDDPQDGAEVETWSDLFWLANGANVEPGTHGLPATFGILPAGSGPDDEIVIELEALAAGSSEVLASRRVKTGFVPGEARLVRMQLYRVCAELTCEPGESCGCANGGACATPSCVNETVDPYDLERIRNTGALPADAGIPDDSGTINCMPPLLLCGADCVNAEADPRYCGDCETSCPTGLVCESGTCKDPGECRTNDTRCSGFSYCDEDSGECLPGCTETQQCTGEHEVCDTVIHDCVCAEDFERCDGICSNTQDDPRYCGSCTRSCPRGHVCSDGSCIDPGDCRFSDVGCSGFTYCDQASGECLLGCEDDEQCTEDNETCDTDTHDCDCALGFHRCGPVCVSSIDLDTCGDLCTPCEAPPNASPVCEFEACDFVCDDDYERCDEMCCPTSCPPGQALLGGTCAKVHIQIANDAGNVGEYSALALDLNGVPHISHYASNGRDLAVSAQQADATWIAEEPDGPDDVGKHTSISFDGDGVLHVAYYNASSKELMLASKPVGLPWTLDVVDGQRDVGEFTSLAFDGAGTAHISYYDRGNTNLLYARRPRGEAWSVETVDKEDVGQYTSLAIAPSGEPQISYYDAAGKNLKRALRDPDGSWRIQTIASIGNVGKYSSLAFDPQGVTHISYYHETNEDLIYATEALAGFWVFETVESQPNVGKFASLAFDAQGIAHISYYDETDRDLKIARRLPNGVWSIEVVDGEGDVGQYSSIAVDSLGQSHISYYDVTNTNSKYALVAAPAPSSVP
ncbi:MAG: hypothetical protein OEN21_17275 [Myxococcales bacterium]|nr:hypothetical protein [Myxococcales bacterium]